MGLEVEQSVEVTNTACILQMINIISWMYYLFNYSMADN